MLALLPSHNEILKQADTFIITFVNDIVEKVVFLMNQLTFLVSSKDDQDRRYLN